MGNEVEAVNPQVLDDVENDTDILTWMELLNPDKYIAKPRIPTKEEYDQLVEETALGYFTDTELATRFRSSETVIKKIQAHPLFKSDVLKKRRELDDTGDSVRAVARRELRGVLPEMSNVVRAAESQVARTKAFDQIRKTAGLGENENKDPGIGVGVKMEIHTNLGMGEVKGDTYVVEAKALSDDNFEDLL